MTFPEMWEASVKTEAKQLLNISASLCHYQFSLTIYWSGNTLLGLSFLANVPVDIYVEKNKCIYIFKWTYL